MNHRWCILGTPRSGSNYLESSIAAAIGHYTLVLGEFYHYYEGFVFDINGMATYKHIRIFNQSRLDYINKINAKLDENPEQPATIRLFFQPELISYIDFEKVLVQKQLQNFKFLRLNRDIKSRFLSFIVAKHTNLWRSLRQSAILDNKLIIDLEMARKTYRELLLFDTYLEMYSKLFSPVVINYDTLEQDCIQNNIPFDKSVDVKTYEQSYSEIIENYDEIMEIIPHE